eukprot:CAMPEP_0170611418 /NCGR_PEP_ID=MMETSP0224-20130122/23179_1 /TAXON_ID=285029 /ORGANISM="Togula jolla, Strain CCCM 725" /LENGTH=713 /DNA_ID=CAMNT_0010936853 /DNA_START=10 /DNA_END=2151 /DNA_ORIENTATION=-
MTFFALLAAASAVSITGGTDTRASLRVNPVQKVVTLLTQLEVKIMKDGQEEVKAFEAYADWCKNGAKEKEFEIKTAESDIEDLSATIGKAESDTVSLASKVEDLSAAISTNEADLKAATDIREKEHVEFVATEKELTDAIDTLERAINILDRKMKGSAMLQATVDRRDVGKLVHTLSAIIDAAALSLHDKQKLLGLVQSSEEEDDDDAMEPGAPAAEAYKGRSESIVDVLEDLKQKAMVQLEEARREEVNARHNFELLQQSLQDQIKVDNKEFQEAKALKHDAAATRANAEGALGNTKKTLEDAQNVLKNMKGDCMSKATDHEISVKAREEELKAIAAAKEAIQGSAYNAANLVYNASSFLQLDAIGAAGSSASQIRTRTDLANFEVVNLVRKLAREHKSAMLAQLAGRISAAMRVSGSAGEDPFQKVRGMISDMIERLTQAAGEEAQHKAYCDKEMGETKQKLEELRYDIEKHSSKIDKAKADAAMLRDEVAVISGELLQISRSQSEADVIRKEEKDVYLQAKTDLQQGLEGIRMALKLLREYYTGSGSLLQQPDAPGQHSKSAGAGSTIIGLLEVVESDLGKSLASTEMNEEAAANAYERMSMENRVSKTIKEKDVTYKTKEAAALEKSANELASDRESAQTELDAVLAYSTQIRGMCELRPETYEQRADRRLQEIAGLREALRILEGEDTFLQRQKRAALRASFLAVHSK